MRNRRVFLSLIAVAAVVAATGATAQGTTPPQSCTTTNLWSVTATGPTTGPCPGSPDTCTAIAYSIPGIGALQPSTDHVATLVHADVVPFALDPPASKFANACGAGDSVTGFGIYACHEQAVRLNAGQTKNDEFRIVAKGTWVATKTTLLVKKGKSIGSCTIVGLGPQPTPTVAPVTEVLTHAGCAVQFTLDGATGSVLSAALVPELSDKPLCEPNPPNRNDCCSLLIDDVQNLEITLGGQLLGTGKFGNGYVQSGDASCTTRIVGGRVYTFGSPCPQ
jgi:hypothetical protein